MFRFEDIKVLHLEATTNCNAKCPQCTRTIHADKLVMAEWSLDQFKQLIPEELIKNLDKILLCGVLGDPAAAKDLLKILRWARTIHPAITIGMNTNGGIRSARWWQELATLMVNPTDYVVFSIDGLSDTNHVYRINVDWAKLMKNATAFINNGGKAHWDMLVYAHNEHQVVDSEALAKAMGFTHFRSKVTRRKINVDFLKLPSTATASPVIPIASMNIDCHALNERSVHVTADGHLFPCCFMGPQVFTNEFKNQTTLDIDEMTLHNNSIAEILQKFSSVTDSWGNAPAEICATSCRSLNGTTQFRNQWKSDATL